MFLLKTCLLCRRKLGKKFTLGRYYGHQSFFLGRIFGFKAASLPWRQKGVLVVEMFGISVGVGDEASDAGDCGGNSVEETGVVGAEMVMLVIVAIGVMAGWRLLLV